MTMTMTKRLFEDGREDYSQTIDRYSLSLVTHLNLSPLI